MSIDTRALDALIEESQDLHVDAMRTTREGLSEIVEHGQEIRAAGGYDPEEVQAATSERRRLLTAAGAVAGGAALLSVIGASPAFADQPADIAAGQTAASIENLAIAVYNKAATLPFMASIPAPAGPTVVAFVKMTIQQHTDHASAFNSAVGALGGKPQTQPDMVVYNAVVTPALPTLKTPLDVVKFATTLEQAAASTYVAAVGSVTDKKLRGTFASIMGVEAQHVSTLLAVGALLQGGAPQLIKIPTDPAALPAAAGSVGFPDSFLKTDMARPLTEGAVK